MDRLQSSFSATFLNYFSLFNFGDSKVRRSQIFAVESRWKDIAAAEIQDYVCVCVYV